MNRNRGNKNARRARPGAVYTRSFDQRYDRHSARHPRSGQGLKHVAHFLTRTMANLAVLLGVHP